LIPQEALVRNARKILGGSAVALGAAGALLATQAGAGAAAALPVSWNFPQGFVSGLLSPQTAAPGAIAVDFQHNVVPAACHSAVHPVPVVLIHGTWENQNDNWQAMAPWLKNNGYCVYSFTYGQGMPGEQIGGTIHVWESAAQVGQAVNLVLKATGAPQVDFVGHSQGAGITPSWYIDYLMRNNDTPNGPINNPAPETSGPSLVRKFIMIAPSLHGTTLSGIATLGQALSVFNILGIISVEVPAASDQTTLSVATKHILSFGDTAPGVQYTTVIEKGDQVVTPYQQQILSTTNVAAGASVNNIILQNSFTVNYHNDVTGKTSNQFELPCPLDGGEHLAGPYNSRVGRIVTDTLGGTSTGGYLDPYCHGILPLVGG
jgi:triacylglycerol esterase/lipase EstA (alpha/beta hydrolase family)